jgi:DNA gyrase subunit A
MGIVCHNLNEKTGLLAGISVVDDDNDIMMITDQGQMIRIRVSDVPTYSRSARGVIVMRLAEDQHIVNFTKVAKEEPEDEVAPEVAPIEEGDPIDTIDETDALEVELVEAETVETVEEEAEITLEAEETTEE